MKFAYNVPTSLAKSFGLPFITPHKHRTLKKFRIKKPLKKVMDTFVGSIYNQAGFQKMGEIALQPSAVLHCP